jgi:hypothetical protein
MTKYAQLRQMSILMLLFILSGKSYCLIQDSNEPPIDPVRKQVLELANKAGQSEGYDDEVVDSNSSGGEAEYYGLEGSYEPHSVDYVNKYIDCGIDENTVKGGQYTEQELDELCEELSNKKYKKYLVNGLFVFFAIILLLLFLKYSSKRVKSGLEFQKMAEAFNGVYGMISQMNFSDEKMNSEENKSDLLYCAHVSKKEILDRIKLYEWNELTPINIPLISNNRINLKIALNKTVREIRNISVILNLEKEVNEILSTENLTSQNESDLNVH